MASVICALRTCGLMFSLFFYVHANDVKTSEPRIISFNAERKICDENNCKYLLNIRVGGFVGHYSWRLTPVEGSRGDICDVIYPNYEIKEISTKYSNSTYEINLPHSRSRIYFCLFENSVRNSPFGGKWVHQGAEYFLDVKSNSSRANYKEDSRKTNSWLDLSHDTDVNSFRPPKPDGEESRDIEVLINDKYVPLNEVENSKRAFGDVSSNSIERFKRNLIKDYDFKKSLHNMDSEKQREPSQEMVFVERNGDNEVADQVVRKELTEPIGFKINLDNIEREELTTISQESAVNKELTDSINENKENSLIRQKIKENKALSQDLTDTNERFWRNLDNIENEERTTLRQELTDSTNEFKDGRGLGISEEMGDPKFKREVKHDNETVDRTPRQVTVPDLFFTSLNPDQVVVFIEGVRVEDSEKEPKIVDDGIPSVLADSKVVLRLFGIGLTSRTVIAFTHEEQQYGQPCKFLLKGEYMVKDGSLQPKTALFDIIAPSQIAGSKLYICAKNLRLGVDDPFNDDDKYIHQGTDSYKMLATHNSLLPLWVSLTLILTCLTFSALFSGLNLGLMSLDRTELKIISNTGTEQEKKYARAIMPVRDHGNYLLCSILLGNVAVNSTFTILLDELTSGLFAVIFSTLAIVLLGEITPQAICSRHGLMVGARSIMVTKSVMALTAPLAYPISKLLDYFLGEEIGNVYNRERLKELVKVTTDVNDLDRDEVNIISGALELRKKCVTEVMTKLEDVFMLPITSVLDFETMSEIIKSGYSRIPVYEGARGHIVTVLFIKDLAFVDPDDNTPLRTLCQYYQNPCNFVFEDVTLDVMFKQFKEGHKGHMAFVHRINNEGEGDPFYETIGLVTLEDVIEEMIQAEIIDETDVFMDNRSKRRRNRPQNKLQDFAAFAERHENQRIHISPQLTLATFQFLSTSVDAFRPDTVSETVLRRLLRQDVIQYIKLKGKTKKDPTTFVFQQGKPVDYFVLILEGRVEVTVGRENLVFEAGPFTYFGVQALTQNVGVAESPTPSAMGSLQNINMDSMLRHTFVPDYSVRAITELYYLTVKRSLYLAAKRATLMEKGALSKGATNEQFDTEVDKLLQSVDEDISITGEHKTPSRQVSPNPIPVCASPHARGSLASRTSPERAADIYQGAKPEEQEKLLK